MRLASHPAARAQRARDAFRAWRGVEGEALRAAEIAQLPTVEWKGRTLYTTTCHGTTGKGPHQLNVEEGLLWSLIDLRAFRCPHHA